MFLYFTTTGTCTLSMNMRIAWLKNTISYFPLDCFIPQYLFRMKEDEEEKNIFVDRFHDECLGEKKSLDPRGYG